MLNQLDPWAETLFLMKKKFGKLKVVNFLNFFEPKSVINYVL